jgi:hypothetical protein
MTANPPDLPPDTRTRPTPSAHDIATPEALRDTLDYMRSMLTELSGIARRQRLDMLAYLIEMASVEASDALARDGARRKGGRRRAGASDQ